MAWIEPTPIFERLGLFAERHEPFEMAAAHWHSHVEINYLSSGQMTYLVSGRLVRLTAERFGLFWGASPHQVIHQSDDSEIIVVYVPLPTFLRLALPARFRQRIMGGGYIVDRINDPIDSILLPRWYNDLQHDDDVMAHLVRQEVSCRIKRLAIGGGEVLRSIDVAARPVSQNEPVNLTHVRDMVITMASRFSEPLSVNDVAVAVGLHPNYAMAIFRKVIGMTILEFLTRQRLSHAQAMLADTDVAIEDVLTESGFGSRSAFYDVFAQHVGMSPSRYRAALARAIDKEPFANGGSVHVPLAP
ncbi:MAG: helix-turn-helix domain-containing protein [Pseudomonadota bacterium]